MLMERDPVVTISHRFDEPPEVVFDAWLDPKVARRWMFTTGDDTNVRCDIDAKVGGPPALESDSHSLQNHSPAL